MKQFAAMLLTLALVPALSHAETTGAKASEYSLLGGLSVLVASSVIIESPFLVVGKVLDSSSKNNQVDVRVETDQGKAETLALSKDAAAKANLQAGDKLTVKPAKSGAILAKNGTPIAFMVTPENAKLSHSHELAR
jgi:hypothetical protein